MSNNNFNTYRNSLDNITNKIWVTTSQLVYTQGDTIHGTVELRITPQSGPLTNVRAVVLRVTGYEKIMWQERKEQWVGDGADPRLVESIEDFSDRQHFFKKVIVVHQPLKGCIDPGTYHFPFSYTLPENLPGTYFQEGGSKQQGNFYSARILYKLKAVVDTIVTTAHQENDDNDDDDNTCSGNNNNNQILQHTLRLVVNDNFDYSVPQYVEAKKAGELDVKLMLNKTAYFPGETVIAKIKVNNLSKSGTGKVTCRVIHQLQMLSSQPGSLGTMPSVVVAFNNNNNSNNNGSHFHQRIEQRVLWEKEYSAGYFEPFFYGVRFVGYHIPMKILPSSTTGRFLRSTHCFSVEIDGSGTMSSGLILTQPLRILAPEFLWKTALADIPPRPPMADIPNEVRYRPPWQPDSATSECTKCNARFTTFNRRHHCRNCGMIFCAKCASKKSTITNVKITTPVLVCDDCFPIAQQGGKKYQTQKNKISNNNNNSDNLTPVLAAGSSLHVR